MMNKRILSILLIVVALTTIQGLGSIAVHRGTTAHSNHITPTTCDTGGDNSDPNTNGGDGHAGGNPNPSTGRIAPADCA